MHPPAVTDQGDMDNRSYPPDDSWGDGLRVIVVLEQNIVVLEQNSVDQALVRMSLSERGT